MSGESLRDLRDLNRHLLSKTKTTNKGQRSALRHGDDACPIEDVKQWFPAEALQNIALAVVALR